MYSWNTNCSMSNSQFSKVELAGEFLFNKVFEDYWTSQIILNFIFPNSFFPIPILEVFSAKKSKFNFIIYFWCKISYWIIRFILMIVGFLFNKIFEEYCPFQFTWGQTWSPMFYWDQKSKFYSNIILYAKIQYWFIRFILMIGWLIGPFLYFQFALVRPL